MRFDLKEELSLGCFGSENLRPRKKLNLNIALKKALKGIISKHCLIALSDCNIEQDCNWQHWAAAVFAVAVVYCTGLSPSDQTVLCC